MDCNFWTLQNENLGLFGVVVRWTECDAGRNYDGAWPNIKEKINSFI
jgi:hypothetical protein